MTKVDFLIEKFGLQAHPEGGYFSETYRSEGFIAADSLPQEYSGNRNYSTSIYFLLTSDTFSAFHKINQDEVWHFYAGSPLKIYMISEDGRSSEQVLGVDFSKNQVPQFVVPGGHWFAAKTIEENSFSFVGCTVAPGFDFADFVLPSQQEFLKKFPEHKTLIKRFTRI